MQTPVANSEVSESSPAPELPRRRAWYQHLSLQILIGVVLGVIVGYVWPQRAETLKPLGDLFIRLVRMLVAPIIFCTVAAWDRQRWRSKKSRPRSHKIAHLF